MDLSTMTAHGIGKQNVLQTHGPQYNDNSWHWKTKCPANSWTSVQWQLMALENKMSCKLTDLSTMTTHGIGKQNVLQTHGPQYNDGSWHWKTKCPANSWTSVQWQLIALENKMSCKLMDLSTMTTHGIGKQNVLQTHGPQYNDRSWHQQQCDAQAQQCLQLPAVKYLLNFPLKHLNCQSMTQKLTWCPN